MGDLAGTSGSLACSPLLPSVNKLKELAQKLFIFSAAAVAYNGIDLDSEHALKILGGWGKG